MKKFLVATLLAIMPYTATHAYYYIRDTIDTYLGSSYSTVDEYGNCSDGECSEGSDCYSVGDTDGTESCDGWCYSQYDSGGTIWDGDELACGCSLWGDEEWRASGTGRERKYVIEETDCARNTTETATNEYRCAAGYYGNGTTCTRCPGVKNSAGTTVYGNSPAGATSVTQCQLPAGTYTDATGTFTLSAPCAYN